MCPKDRANSASLYCEADACYLCSACDDVVHGANRLAGRHVRRPIELSDVSSSSALDECNMNAMSMNLNMLFEDHNSHITHTSTKNENDYDLADLAAMPPLPLDSLFGTRTVPSLEWDAVLGALPPNTPITPELSNHMTQAQQIPVVVRRVKSEPNLMVEPPSPISSVTEGSVTSSPPAAIPIAHPSQQQSGMTMAISRPTSIPSPNTSCVSISSNTSGDVLPSVAQRKQLRAKALARFRSKRASRSFAKRVRYECRKQLADSRPRVKGRFVKKSEMALYRKYGELYRNYMHEINDMKTENVVAAGSGGT